MTVFDLFVLAIVGASVAAGALRGFVRALIASVGLVVGLLFEARFYEPAGALLKSLGLVEHDLAVEHLVNQGFEPRAHLHGSSLRQSEI